jgi:hypothetical protein
MRKDEYLKALLPLASAILANPNYVLCRRDSSGNHAITLALADYSEPLNLRELVEFAFNNVDELAEDYSAIDYDLDIDFERRAKEVRA